MNEVSETLEARARKPETVTGARSGTSAGAQSGASEAGSPAGMAMHATAGGHGAGPALTKKLGLRKPRGQGATRRGEILEAAKRLFTEEGFAHATMRRIAAEVGVSPTALYLHFADKEAIMRAIASDFFSELLVRLQATQSLDLPLLARLRAGLRAYIDFGMDRADEYRLTFRNRVVREPSPCTGLDVADMSFAVLEHGVDDLLREGVFRPGDKVVIAETIWCCLHGLTSALIDMTDAVCTAHEALIDHVIETLIAGLSAPQSGTHPAI